MYAINNAKKIVLLVLLLVSLLPGLFSFLAPAWSEGAGPARGAPLLTILYTGNTLEEIKPCGCSKEADFGGLLRRGSAIKAVAESGGNLLVLDAGDNIKGTSPQGALKARLLSRGLAVIDYDAALPGEKDFEYGASFFERGGFSGWLASNLDYNEVTFNKMVIKEMGEGLRAGVFGIIDPDLFKAPSHMGISVAGPEDFLKKRLKAVLDANRIDFPILLFHGDEALARKIFYQYPLIKVVIAAHTDNPLGEDEKKPLIDHGRGLFFADNRARRLGSINVAKDEGTGEFLLEHQWISLSADLPDDPALAPLFKDYKAKVKELFLEKSRRKKEFAETSPYASADRCAPCHKEIAAGWKETAHANALNTLKGAGYSFDPECVKCHVLGFDKGGYVDESQTPGLGGVQCESCHGLGKEHALDPSKKYGTVPSDKCMECHTKVRDPRFSFELYWKRIRHGGKDVLNVEH